MEDCFHSNQYEKVEKCSYSLSENIKTKIDKRFSVSAILGKQRYKVAAFFFYMIFIRFKKYIFINLLRNVYRNKGTQNTIKS